MSLLKKKRFQGDEFNERELGLRSVVSRARVIASMFWRIISIYNVGEFYNSFQFFFFNSSLLTCSLINSSL